ncbi:MAG: hypothetical protein M3O90_11600 [Actinomycetota bacterium]|nr:hypothetical protein [Actinomycetota bacterium]
MIGAAGPSALWYLTRGTGLVTLVLLTASVVLGVLQVLRWAPPGSPRFMVVTLHRAISLLVVALLVVHVLTIREFDPVAVKDFMGHSKITTTERYLHAQSRRTDAARMTKAFAGEPAELQAAAA